MRDPDLNLVIEWLDEGGTKSLSGRAWPRAHLAINGQPLHLFALRVTDDATGAQVAWGAGFRGEVEAAQALNDGRLETVELPSCEGEWIILAHPHSD